MSIRAIVTDIEGTTTEIQFVSQVLFPYAAAALPDFIHQHQYRPDVAAQLQHIRQLINQPEADTAQLIAILLQWIQTDQKMTPLKELQGLVWASGYQNGTLKGHLYPDVLPALTGWYRQGIGLYVYSSGSVAAQRLLFSHSVEGDISGLFLGHFDTHIGAKKDSSSYRAIAAQLALPATEILFLSDHPDEILAAQAAGWHCIQLLRDGQYSELQPQATDFIQVNQLLEAL
ncbi:acireductone synthase [Rheinheimera sp.]|uniref:acireductone synthase n=1 Tax=Rheinheimera sp. TaxID=1869214 RepID=UPI00307EC8A9